MSFHPPQPADRIRGRTLQKIRDQWLRAHPLCEHCLAADPSRVTAATELDHIVALVNGGPDFDRDDGKNRQSMCTDHHLAKTAADLGHTYTPRQTIGADGWPTGSAVRISTAPKGVNRSVSLLCNLRTKKDRP